LNHKIVTIEEYLQLERTEKADFEAVLRIVKESRSGIDLGYRKLVNEIVRLIKDISMNKNSVIVQRFEV
jgi:hypothetical protein